jgi:hypothetical protein
MDTAKAGALLRLLCVARIGRWQVMCPEVTSLVLASQPLDQDLELPVGHGNHYVLESPCHRKLIFSQHFYFTSPSP